MSKPCTSPQLLAAAGVHARTTRTCTRVTLTLAGHTSAGWRPAAHHAGQQGPDGTSECDAAGEVAVMASAMAPHHTAFLCCNHIVVQAGTAPCTAPSPCISTVCVICVQMRSLLPAASILGEEEDVRTLSRASTCENGAIAAAAKAGAAASHALK